MVCYDGSEDDSKSRILTDRARRLATLTDWIAELDPLLSDKEKQIVIEIESEVNTVCKSRWLPPSDPSSDPPFDPPSDSTDAIEKILILEENLKLIIQSLKTYRGDKEHFLREFNNWHKIRQQNVKALKTIGESIHTDRKKCNVSRLIGNCTSFVGGGICIASAALTPFTLGLSTPVFIAGAATTAVGSVTSVGTSITEIVLLKKEVEKAKKIIEKDKSSFKPLEMWLVSANDLVDARNAILTMDVVKKMENTLQNLYKSFIAAVEISNTELRIQLIRKLVRDVIANISPEFAVLAVIPPLIALLLILSLLLYNYQTVIDNATMTFNTIADIFSSVAVIPLSLLQPAVGAFIKSEASVTGSVAKAVVARGILAALGMTIDAASIVLTAIDLSEGSVNEKGKMIIEVSNKMKEETNVLQKVYYELVSSCQ